MGKSQSTSNEWVHRSFEVSSVVDDILEHLGVIIVAEAGHGKSYTAFTLAKEGIQRNNVSVIIFSPSTIWRRKFGAISCVKVGTRDFNPVIRKDKVSLYQGIIPNLRDTIWVNLDKKWSFQWSRWLRDLLESKQHLLFEIKYRNGRRIKHFESQVLSYLYDMQERYLDINPNYNHHYIVVFEELQNAFGTYSMNTDDSLELMTVFTQSRSDANIHYIGIGQRLNDISTKICERLRPLVGLTIGENSLRKIKSQLPKHLRAKVQKLPQRHWIYLNGKSNPVVEIPLYKKQGKPIFLKPTKPKSTLQYIVTQPKEENRLRKLGRFIEAILHFPFVKPTVYQRPNKEEDRENIEDSQGDGLMCLDDEDILFPPEFEEELEE